MNPRAQSIFEGIDKNLLKKFKAYHSKYPEIYAEFKACCYRMLGVRKKYSAWTVINVIRWNHDLKFSDPFKINNDFIAIFARLLIYHDPQFEGFFELRKMKGSNRRDSREERYRLAE